MNFEDRKAEILRRSDARIASRKRKRRMVLGAVIPVALVAVLAYPVSRLFSDTGKAEKDPTLMSAPSTFHQFAAATSPESVVFDNASSQQPADKPVRGTLPPCTTGAALANPGLPTDGASSQPPAIAITSYEGESISPNLIGYMWPCEKDGTITLMENAIYYRTSVRIHSQYPALELDFGDQSPLNVVAQCWNLAEVSSDEIVDGQALSAELYVPFGEDRQSEPYKITGKSGDYLYQITVTWPQGTGWYVFRAVVE